MLKKDKLSIIRKWYPNAITTIDSVNKIIDYIENKLELEPQQVMFGDSICSDGVNSIQYPVRASEFLGPFKMGGLDGFPFTGLTGMAAFASHVPDDGAVYIYYGPHVGITKSGVIGEIHRLGQSKNSNCCGAARGALDKLLNDQIEEGNISEIDYQMNTIEQILLSQKDRIINAPTQLFEATEVIYEAIDKRINELIEKTDYHCRYIILMGAILINSDSDMGSFTQIKKFEILDLKKNTRTNSLDYMNP
jgi:hypothetical protein